jgi:hypothetical protein
MDNSQIENTINEIHFKLEKRNRVLIFESSILNILKNNNLEDMHPASKQFAYFQQHPIKEAVYVR